MNFQPDPLPLAGLAFDQGHLISPVSCLRLPLRGRDGGSALNWAASSSTPAAQHRLLIEARPMSQAEWQPLRRGQREGDGRLSAKLAGTVKTSFRYMAMDRPSSHPSEKLRWALSGENDVDLLEGLSEVPRDEGAHLPRLVVVGIIVASGENIGADEDAPFHLVPETGPRVASYILQSCSFHPEPVATPS